MKIMRYDEYNHIISSLITIAQMNSITVNNCSNQLSENQATLSVKYLPGYGGERSVPENTRKHMKPTQISCYFHSARNIFYILNHQVTQNT